MHANSLKRIMGELPEPLNCAKPLCLKIWNFLFPIVKGGRVAIGTPMGDLD
jgi:hypothetical protein